MGLGRFRVHVPDKLRHNPPPLRVFFLFCGEQLATYLFFFLADPLSVVLASVAAVAARRRTSWPDMTQRSATPVGPSLSCDVPRRCTNMAVSPTMVGGACGSALTSSIRCFSPHTLRCRGRMQSSSLRSGWWRSKKKAPLQRRFTPTLMLAQVGKFYLDLND